MSAKDMTHADLLRLRKHVLEQVQEDCIERAIQVTNPVDKMAWMCAASDINQLTLSLQASINQITKPNPYA